MYICYVGLFSRSKNNGYSQAQLEEAISRSITDTLRIANLQGFALNPHSTNVNRDTTLGLSAVWSCVKLLSETFAGLPFHIYKQTDTGNELAKGHSLSQLVGKQPHPEMTAFVWRSLAMSKLLLDGNFIAFIERDAEYNVTGLVPIFSPIKVSLTNGEAFYKFDLNGKEYIKSSENIFHVKGYTDDGVVGKSVIQVHKDNFGIGLSTQKASKDFYEKGAKLDGYLSTDIALKEDTYKRVKESFNNRSDERVPLLDAGLKYYPIKLNPADAQYIERGKFSELDIARIFRVPPHMIGILDRATWNNVEALGIEFAKYTMLPICINWEQEIERKLLRDKERGKMYAKFELDGIMRADLKTRYESYQIGINNGFMSINEARGLENKNPVEGGDKHYIPGNNLVDITKEPENIVTE